MRMHLPTASYYLLLATCYLLLATCYLLLTTYYLLLPPRYACTFPAMISQWRSAFAQPEAYFGFIQVSSPNPNPDPSPHRNPSPSLNPSPSSSPTPTPTLLRLLSSCPPGAEMVSASLRCERAARWQRWRCPRWDHTTTPLGHTPTPLGLTTVRTQQCTCT